mmetsp:Transcript_43953/g.83936  ORF Transcript_43953/g.83936 Transcript_43953/m.83936 type:complete len:357 (-) Transcript_43953:126-1196(-)|eukprot:CAMPEP_0114234098 /NCGR_PEP_ID=MMETSP0058-20121206/5533_1 /TAXON_ID=36894 /ORGANISM="Pyramimonas parkeae, CCMP726" /LENGTH=356 /DNA_ID=CAMNT_0001345765 /DNA_START=2622 /DNA_END=3692 /DNA_ORIENTATION=-
MNVNGITEAGADVASESIVPKFAPQTLPMYARLQDGHTLEKHPARPKLERQTSSVSLPGYPSANDVIPKTGLSHSYLGLNQEPDPLARMRLWYDSSFADPEATPSGPDEREQKFQGGPKIPSTSQPRGFSKLRTVRSMRGPLGHSTRDLMLRIRRDMRAIPTADGKEAVQTENAVANSELCSQTCQGKPRHSNHSCNEDKKDAIGTVSEKQSTQVCMANVEEKTLLDNGVKENYKKTLVTSPTQSAEAQLENPITPDEEIPIISEHTRARILAWLHDAETTEQVHESIDHPCPSVKTDNTSSAPEDATSVSQTCGKTDTKQVVRNNSMRSWLRKTTSSRTWRRFACMSVRAKTNVV